MKTLLFFALIAAGTVLADHDWSRYESIIERSPFGKEPPPPETTADRQAGSFAKEYRLSMLYKDAEGRLKAGMVSKVNNKSLLLSVGESDGDISLVDVQMEEGTAVLQRGQETAQLLLEGLDIPFSAGASGSNAPQHDPVQIRTRPTLFRQAGTAEKAPAHIRMALKDSTPKRATLTVVKKKKNPAADSGEEETSLHASTLLSGNSVSGSRPDLPTAGNTPGPEKNHPIPAVILFKARPVTLRKNCGMPDDFSEGVNYGTFS